MVTFHVQPSSSSPHHSSTLSSRTRRTPSRLWSSERQSSRRSVSLWSVNQRFPSFASTSFCIIVLLLTIGTDVDPLVPACRRVSCQLQPLVGPAEGQAYYHVESRQVAMGCEVEGGGYGRKNNVRHYPGCWWLRAGDGRGYRVGCSS